MILGGFMVHVLILDSRQSIHCNLILFPVAIVACSGRDYTIIKFYAYIQAYPTPLNFLP